MQTSLTAVKMLLQPGALRELHWHPHADEWQYFVSGRGAGGRIRVARPDAHRRVRTGRRGVCDAGARALHRADRGMSRPRS